MHLSLHITRSRLDLIGFTLVCGLLYIKASIGTPICFRDGDCLSYTSLMDKNSFAAYGLGLWNMSKPPTVGIIYSLFGPLSLQSAITIVFFQTLFSLIAWIAFAGCLARQMDAAWGRYGVYVFTLLSMFGRGFLHFNQFLISESLALSLLLLWLCIIVEIKTLCRWLGARNMKQGDQWLIFMLITFIVAGARDTNAYTAVFSIPVLWVLLWSGHRRLLMGLVCAIVLVFLVTQLAAVSRHSENMFNVMTGYVMPFSEKRIFFSEKGMPLSQALVEDPTVTRSWDIKHFDANAFKAAKWKLAKTIGMSIFDANAIYMQYLLTHPLETTHTLYENRHLMLNSDVKIVPWLSSDIAPSLVFTEGKEEYMQPPVIPQAPEMLSLIDLFPLDGVIMATIVCLLVHIAYACGQREHNAMMIGLLLAVSGLGNTTIAFLGDFWSIDEVKRHCMIGGIIFKAGCQLIIISTLCAILTKHLPYALPRRKFPRC